MKKSFSACIVFLAVCINLSAAEDSLPLRSDNLIKVRCPHGGVKEEVSIISEVWGDYNGEFVYRYLIQNKTSDETKVTLYVLKHFSRWSTWDVVTSSFNDPRSQGFFESKQRVRRLPATLILPPNSKTALFFTTKSPPVKVSKRFRVEIMVGWVEQSVEIFVPQKVQKNSEKHAVGSIK